MRCALIVFSLVAIVYSARASEIKTELIPKGRPFRLTFADPREIRMGISVDGTANRLIGSIGNYFSLFGLSVPEEEMEFHVGLEGAGVFGMRQASSRFPLETTDGIIGAYVEGKWHNVYGQVRYTHLSSHLADGSSGTPIAFSREYLSLRAGWAPHESVYTYIGLQQIANSVPVVPPLALQVGGSFFSPWGLEGLTPFAALDLKLKEESRYNPSISLQLGLAINNPPEAYRSFRCFYWYQAGADPRGQYYDQEQTSHSLGIEMQI